MSMSNSREWVTTHINTVVSLTSNLESPQIKPKKKKKQKNTSEKLRQTILNSDALHYDFYSAEVSFNAVVGIKRCGLTRLQN